MKSFLKTHYYDNSKQFVSQFLLQFIKYVDQWGASTVLATFQLKCHLCLKYQDFNYLDVLTYDDRMCVLSNVVRNYHTSLEVRFRFLYRSLLMFQHSVGKPQQKSHSTFQAKRAMATVSAFDIMSHFQTLCSKMTSKALAGLWCVIA